MRHFVLFARESRVMSYDDNRLNQKLSELYVIKASSPPRKSVIRFRTKWRFDPRATNILLCA